MQINDKNLVKVMLLKFRGEKKKNLSSEPTIRHIHNVKLQSGGAAGSPERLQPYQPRADGSNAAAAGEI